MTHDSTGQAGAEFKNKYWRDVHVTQEMAEYGAEVLKEMRIGDNLSKIVSDIFYAMQAADHPLMNLE